MKKVLCIILLTAAFFGCKKTSVDISPLASLNLVNASVNVSAVKVNFTGNGLPNYYNLITATTAYGANSLFPVNANTTVPVTIINSTDSTKALVSSNLNLANGGIYSLYLAGQSTAVDTIMVKETIPSFQDSSCAVRFINLSYNSNPISITLSTTPTVPEFSGLAYKSAAAFKTYTATAATNTYTFQVRDATTLALLGSYTLTVPRFFACTLAWIGQAGVTGTNAPKVIRINNY